MRKQILIIFVSAVILGLALAGCNSKSAMAAYLPDNIEQIKAGRVLHSNSNINEELELTSIPDWKTWVTGLSLEHKSFKEDEIPAKAWAGGESYSFDINDGELCFDYIDYGTEAYILYGGEWYAVSNPSLPPINNNITTAAVSHIVSGQVTRWVVRDAEAAALQKWFSELKYTRQHFEKGGSPGDADGGEAYSFAFSEGDCPDFSYVLNGEQDCYLLIENEWYTVSNPSLPPVAEPKGE